MKAVQGLGEGSLPGSRSGHLRPPWQGRRAGMVRSENAHWLWPLGGHCRPGWKPFLWSEGAAVRSGG
jgi:hypothetical protein